MTLKSLITMYQLSHEGKVEGIELEIMKEIERLLPEKKCSIWETFKLKKIRVWEGLKSCAECNLNRGCESRMRNKAIDDCLSAIRTGMEGK